MVPIKQLCDEGITQDYVKPPALGGGDKMPQHQTCRCATRSDDWKRRSHIKRRHLPRCVNDKSNNGKKSTAEHHSALVPVGFVPFKATSTTAGLQMCPFKGSFHPTFNYLRSFWRFTDTLKQIKACVHVVQLSFWVVLNKKKSHMTACICVEEKKKGSTVWCLFCEHSAFFCVCSKHSGV